MIDVLASEPHYAEHLRPVFDALPGEVRGTFTANPDELTPGSTVLVAAWKDYAATGERPVVFFEHGAGFTYTTRHRSYAGGPGRERAVLFCNVNEIVDTANKAAYPHAQHAIVGAPKLDTLTTLEPPSAQPPVVAFSWHWNCQVVPETRNALPLYRYPLPKLAAARRDEWRPLGHAHPRAWHQLDPLYRRWRWETARTFDEVARRASVYVCDTSSTIYEFAALGRPVIILNAPWYRRDVEHGLRFWRHMPGIQVDAPEQLDGAIRAALYDDTWADERRRITEIVYPNLGNAAATAAKAILDIL